MEFPKLYAIVDRGTLVARGMPVGDFARELCDAGVRLVQYRDKSGGPQEILRAAKEITEVFAGVDATLILNDRADLAVLAGWGVHVGQGDLSVADARKVFGGGSKSSSRMTERKANTVVSRTAPSLATMGASLRWGTWPCDVVGVSTHNEAQVIEADASGADYVAVGPVFATSTKSDAEPVVGLEGVRRARALTNYFSERQALVAIGGITRENARSVIDAGADSVAVIGGLFVPGMTVRDVARDFLEILR